MRFINELHEILPDVLIVSGLAYGIDINAHRAALQFGMDTVGVLAHGLDRIYPAVHRRTAAEMLTHGGLITEYPSGTNPDRQNFIKRNRIIAGMSDATIVVESAAKGGALITADIAESYNRDCFAFPGRIGDEFSIGCNTLIRNNRAHTPAKCRRIGKSNELGLYSGIYPTRRHTATVVSQPYTGRRTCNVTTGKES